MGATSVSRNHLTEPPTWAVKLINNDEVAACENLKLTPRYRENRLAGDPIVANTGPIERSRTTVPAILSFIAVGALIGAASVAFAVWQSFLTIPN